MLAWASSVTSLISTSGGREMPHGPPPSGEDIASIRGLGLAVERLRREQDISREEVAERGNLPAAVVGEIEAAEIDREPRWGDLRRVAKGLEVELDYLIRLSYEMAPGPAGDRLRESELEKDQ